MRQSASRLLREVAPAWVQALIDQARAVADAVGVRVYLVGGAVRDLLLGRPSEDLDLVVEGDGIAFANGLCEVVGGRCHPHAPFLTSVVTLPDGHRVDVASARTEFYRTPAALPEVETSLIRQDLYRRDFTINALAVALGGDRHGELVDFFGGRKDLQRREIRVLHSLSFIDDPTRAIRAVRYARRLGFTIAPDTRNLVITAVREKVFERLSGQRLRRELEQLLAEAHPARSVVLLAELGVLPALLPDLVWSEEVRAFLFLVEGQLTWFQLERLGAVPEGWLLFLGALVLHADDGAGERLASRLQLSGELHARLAQLGERVASLQRMAGPSWRRSQRVRGVEAHPVEVLLLAMAGLDLESRWVLADAAEASVRVRPRVRGGELLAAGIGEGPHVGEALERTRDALVDGDIVADQAFDFAVAQAASIERAQATAAERG